MPATGAAGRLIGAQAICSSEVACRRDAPGRRLARQSTEHQARSAGRVTAAIPFPGGCRDVALSSAMRFLAFSRYSLCSNSLTSRSK